MNKLSDEMIQKANERHQASMDGVYEYDYILGSQDTRDFDDSQIDAQAKTMNDLLYAFFSTKIDKSTIDWCEKRDLQMSEVVRVHFSMYVSFFLAAGGTIKDGE